MRHLEEPLARYKVLSERNTAMHLPKVKIYQLFTLRNELEAGPVLGILGPTLCRVLIPPPPPPPQNKPTLSILTLLHSQSPALLFF